MLVPSVLLPPLLAAVALLSAPAAGSLCICDQKACPTVACDAGRTPVKDRCNCCLVCGQAENERCGGNHELYGRCSEGLECRRQPPEPGQPIGQATKGVCTRVGCTICQLMLGICVCTEVEDCPDISRNPTAFYSRAECEKAVALPPPVAATTVPPTAAAGGCAGVLCPAAGEGASLQRCPVDSVLKMTPSARPECCPPVAECVCDLESCPPRPRCARGQLTLRQTGKRRPGACCSSWECKVDTAAADPCANVTCPAAAACPAGSYRTAPEGCCPGQCACQPAPCPTPDCPAGTRPRLLIEGTGKPGACCSVYQCENSSCVHQDKVYREGASWRVDQCTTCHCKDAVSFCDKMQCPDLGDCPQVTDPGQCCPRCIDGCLSQSGVYHNNSEQWREDECTTCSCADNNLHCHIERCTPSCRHPAPVAGLCCPVCDNNECGVVCEHGYRKDDKGRPLCECLSVGDVQPTPRPTATTRRPPRCRDISNCRKKCSHGFRLDARGCERCKCHHCRRLKGCSLDCPLAVNERGCKVCRCRQATTDRPKPTPTPTVHPLSCITTAGEVHAPGASWNDGCRLCYCHEGAEMCTIIACPVPACEHPEIEPGHCCPTCPDDPPVASRHVNLTVCLSAAGGTYLEGQTWQLDSCTRCLCRGGRVLCSHPLCPPAACPQPQRPPGDCCATCPGDSPTGGSTEPPAGGSSSGGRPCAAGPGPSWPDGAVWRSSACVSCRCRNGATRCYHEQCPKLDCQRPVLSKGRCCPHCIESSAADGSCVQGNRTLASGETWQVDACQSCSCRSGQLTCAQKVCSGGCRGPPPPGHCCPVCKDESKANSRRNFPFLNGTSKVAHRIRVSEAPAPTGQPHPEETDNSQSSLLETVVYPILGVVSLLVLIALIILCVFILRRRSVFTPKQPLQVPTEEEKKPLNGAQTIDFTHLGGLSPRQNKRPPEPVISIIRHA